jgi:hydrogenase 3 maturation protease
VTQTIPQNIFRGKVVIVGIGNILRGDDGLGPALIERLSQLLHAGARLKGNAGAVCLDVGNAPENYAGKIVKEKPDTILIIDALHLAKRPGEYEILVKGDISRCGLTTHDISPTMFLEYLEQETGADILVLGIQPENLKMGDGLSEPVKQALRQIEERLIECMS